MNGTTTCVLSLHQDEEGEEEGPDVDVLALAEQEQPELDWWGRASRHPRGACFHAGRHGSRPHSSPLSAGSLSRRGLLQQAQPACVPAPVA